MGDESSPVAPLSQQEVPVAPLSQWLQLMLAEIARKREEQQSARAEAARRASESIREGHVESDGTENPPSP